MSSKQAAHTRTIAALSFCFCTSAWASPLPPEQTEISVSGIVLDDVESAKTPFGRTPQLDDPEADNPKAFFCNRDRTERLTLVYYEGDTANIVGELRVEQVSTPYVDCVIPQKPPENFVSGKGIRLGMSHSEVIRLLGHHFNEHMQLDETVLSYRIDNAKDSDFLQRHSSPAYYGQYHFRQNRLIKFDFGFEFP